MTDQRSTPAISHQRLLASVMALTSTAAVSSLLERCSSVTATPTTQASPASRSGPTTITPAGSAPKGQRVVARFDPPDLLSNPTSTANTDILTFIGNGLTQIRHLAMDIDKDLAESWTVSPDSKPYTSALRKGVRHRTEARCLPGSNILARDPMPLCCTAQRSAISA